jgi:hypothetical protein
MVSSQKPPFPDLKNPNPKRLPRLRWRQSSQITTLSSAQSTSNDHHQHDHLSL